GLAGWKSVGFAGDRQPLGYVDPVTGCELQPVSGPDHGASPSQAAAVSLDPGSLWQLIASTFAAHQTTGRELRRPTASTAGTGGASRSAPRPRPSRRAPRRRASTFDV